MAVVGIDLGTTNTVVGVARDGQVTAVRDADNEYLIPSVVSFHPSGNVLVGRAAKERRVVDAVNTIYSIKRLIGRSWSSEEVTRARARFPFEMREGPGQAALVVARGETFTLPEISAFVLRHAKALAEKGLGEPVDRAVITVPANFNDLQRAATKVAGRVAGLEVLRILNEPTAAALAYGYGYGKGKGERIVIYDFGGGTFDVTLLDLSGNVFEVLATAGNTFLGGDDIDLAIAERMAKACLAQHRSNALADPQIFERLRYYAERLKVELSTLDEAVIDVPDVGRSVTGKPLRLAFSMTRAELEGLAGPIVDRTFDVCREAMGIARLSPKEFDQVVLVGGSTRLPIVRARVAEYFGQEPLDRINPDEVVAIGAAIQANALTGLERRKSVIPRPPMPAARSLEGSVAAGLPRVQRERRVITGLGLGPVKRAPSLPPPPARKPPPVKGGTLGAGTPAAVISRNSAPPESARGRDSVRPRERISGVDADWSGSASGSSQEDTPTVVNLSPPDPSGEGFDPPTPVTPYSPDDTPPSARMFPDPPAETGTRARGVARPERKSHAPISLRADEDDEDDEVTSADIRFDTPPVSRLPPGKSEPKATRPGTGKPTKSVREPDLGLGVAALEEAPPTIPDASPPPAPLQKPAPAFARTMLGHAPGAPAKGPPLRPPPLATTEPVPEAEPPHSFFTAASPAVHSLSRTAPEERHPPLPQLVDVTPLSLCVETVGGFRDVIIARNTPVPCEQSRTFVTSQMAQQTVLVRVGQGEAARFAENSLLGEVELSGLRSAPRGEVRIVVTFSLDTDGMLDVRAADEATGQASTARLRLVGLPDAEEVGRMTARHLLHPS